MNKEDRKFWTDFRENKSSRISKQEFTKICSMHSVYFNHAFYEPCTCSPKKIQRFINDLNKLYDNR